MENNKNVQDVLANNKQLSDVLEKESIKAQEAEWIEKEIIRQREIEDEIRQRLMEERRILDEKKRSIQDNIAKTEEIKRFNDEHREDIEETVYGLYGISHDKLDGMKAYKKAIFKGIAAFTIIISIALTVFCGYYHGVTEKITLIMFAFTTLEAALLPRDSERDRFMNWLCRVLYYLVLPVMLVLFVSYEMKLPLYALMLSYTLIVAFVVTLISVVSFFEYNPYAGCGKGLRDAGKELKRIKQSAEKNVRKNQKLRKKQEAKEEALQKRLDIKQEREEKRLEKKEQKERLLLEKKQAKEASKEVSKEVHKEVPSIIEAVIESPDDNEEKITKETTDEVAETEETKPEELTTETKEEVDNIVEVVTEEVKKPRRTRTTRAKKAKDSEESATLQMFSKMS